MVIVNVTVDLIPGSALKLIDQFAPKGSRFLGKCNMPGLENKNTHFTNHLLYKSIFIKKNILNVKRIH